MSRNLGALTLLDPSGPAWPVMGVHYLYLYLISVGIVSKLKPGRPKNREISLLIDYISVTALQVAACGVEWIEKVIMCI
jgi:hypothetical protein